MKLKGEALAVLERAGLTAAAWSMQWFGKPEWAGDSCGCPDDRCRGHHHDFNEQCMCLSSLVADASNT